MRRVGVSGEMTVMEGYTECSWREWRTGRETGILPQFHDTGLVQGKARKAMGGGRCTHGNGSCIILAIVGMDILFPGKAESGTTEEVE